MFTAARAREHVTRLVVEVGNSAGAWRAAALDAELAFAWWRSAGRDERPNAAGAYLAAIEREEKAANDYRRAVEACCNATP
jgi:hypothetical protein